MKPEALKMIEADDVGPMSMAVETLAIETRGIEFQTIETLTTTGMVRVKRDPVKKISR